MDIVTQGLMGATLAQAGARQREARLATLVGFCAPLLADADALIRSADDPLLHLEYHRHFSHALAFIPFGALLAALLLWPLLKNRLAFKKIYLYALLGYATAGFLDACTSYGTHLLWPFSDGRIAWSIISIFDPLFSLTLIAALGYGLLKSRPQAARLGVVFAAAYFSVGALQHERAEQAALQTAQQRGHAVERLVVKPTMGNLLLWRSVYQSEGTYYVDAVRVGVLEDAQVFAGAQVAAFDVDRDLPQLARDSVIYRDIQRFEFFSDQFLAWHPERPGVLGDIRYAMLPTSTRPLWGIEFDLDAPQRHVTFDSYRGMPADERQLFLAMLLDRDSGMQGGATLSASIGAGQPIRFLNPPAFEVSGN